MNHSFFFVAAAALACASACGPANTGVTGSSAVTQPALSGTIFTIVFENHDEGQVLNASVPYFSELARTHGSAAAYVSSTHPSLPNYIQMTSGQSYGIGDDADPRAHQLPGQDNLGDQLDAAHVPWRAYMESMGEPCRLDSNGLYQAHHNPFLYFSSLTNDTARCNDRVVDFDQNFAQDLAANRYRYMWITPNMCNDMHDCTPQDADNWLHRVIPQIMASPGYQNGGAIFVLFDEGSLRLFGAGADLPTIVISPKLTSPGYRSNTAFDHRSYLATVEDALGLPRLATTADATPMSEFFEGGTNAATTTSANAGGGSATGTTTP